MNLKEYFENAKGMGVFSTADASGIVDIAIYSTPHVVDDSHVAFIMAERKCHENLKSNSHAAYLFKEKREGYAGLRLYLTKIREEKNSELLASLARRKDPAGGHRDGNRNDFLVFFRVEKVLGLTGSGPCPVEVPST
jgi:hypothetical protein